MIAVIADDFTGAAEICGLGLRYNLEVEMEMAVNSSSKADLLVIATDTRSKNAVDAVRDIETITGQLMTLEPSMIYKKVDSVLRGHIVAELAMQMTVLDKKKALVIPANPVLGRVIRNGVYYLDGRPLHETGFGYDPDFAIASSRIADILRQDGGRVTVAGVDEDIPEAGIIIGEAAEADDFQKWLRRADDDCLLAGASGFFGTILAETATAAASPSRWSPSAFGEKMLFVCGSSFATSKDAVEKAFQAGAAVSIMPEELARMEGDDADLYHQRWASQVISLFKNSDQVIIYPGPINDYLDRAAGPRISRNIAATVRKITHQMILQELMVEGGSTASAVFAALGIEKCHPEQELAYGVIRMRVPGLDGLHVTLKPGSYHWPPQIWAFGGEEVDHAAAGYPEKD
jgi:uncharacterized protein YgbK (DUF1537 family)